MRQSVLFFLTIILLLLGVPVWAQQSFPDWQTEVRHYAQMQDWAAAMQIVDREIARAPEDMDVRAWRARVLSWSGHIAEAEKEYLEIVTVSPSDPDDWLGLGSLYLREGKTEEAARAFDRAVELDPKRADLHVAHGRALLAKGDRKEAQLEFQRALDLDPVSAEARAGLGSVRGEPIHELRFGQENDVFNFQDANHYGSISLVSRWTPKWTTSVAESFYERAGLNANKLDGSVTRRLPGLGALTIGGGKGHDNGVIPTSDVFFEIDHGLKLSQGGVVRGLELVYGQHWYWYSTAHILTVNGTGIVYLPHEWIWSLALIGARSTFPDTGTEWRPSTVTRLQFPLAHGEIRRLSGNVFFAVGTENFALVDQIGRFSSQTYGGGLKLQLTARQDVTSYGSIQKRTQGRTDTNFGLSYGIHF